MKRSSISCPKWKGWTSQDKDLARAALRNLLLSVALCVLLRTDLVVPARVQWVHLAVLLSPIVLLVTTLTSGAVLLRDLVMVHLLLVIRMKGLLLHHGALPCR